MEDQIILRVFQMGIQVKIMLSTISGSPIKAKVFTDFSDLYGAVMLLSHSADQGWSFL